MTTGAIPQVDTAEIVVPYAELDETLPFFKETPEFRVDAIFPAEDPAQAQVDRQCDLGVAALTACRTT